MVIFFIFVSTIFLMGILCGALALMMNFEEVPSVKNSKELPLHPDLCKFPVPVREEVPVSGEVPDPVIRPQPVVVPQPMAIQEEESISSN